MVGPDASVDGKFILEQHDVERWMDSGKLDQVLEGFCAGHGLRTKKVRKEPHDLTYIFEDGLAIRGHRVPKEEVPVDTDKYILSAGVQGITKKNYEKAEKLWYDLSGIPI